MSFALTRVSTPGTGAGEERQVRGTSKLAIALVMSLALAACGGSAGDPEDPPRAAGSAVVTSPPPLLPTGAPKASPTPPKKTKPVSPLAGVDPCGLLPAAFIKQHKLSLQSDGAEKIGRARVCRWRYEGTTLRESFTVGVEIFDDLGLDELVSDESSPTTVGGRPGRVFRQAALRGVALGVGESTRVDNTAVGGEEELARQWAADIAKAVEPNLP